MRPCIRIIGHVSVCGVLISSGRMSTKNSNSCYTSLFVLYFHRNKISLGAYLTYLASQDNFSWVPHCPKIICLGYVKMHSFHVILKMQFSRMGLCNSYTMGCPPVRGDNPRALASGLSYVQVDKHGITILYHLHQCRPCTSRDI